MRYQIVVSFFFCLSVIGCSPNSALEKRISDYALLIESISPQNGSFHFTQDASIKSFPQRARLNVPIENIDIQLSDFYAISGCPLASLVAERNSAMGTIQLPSQRFIYEKKLLNTFTHCIASIRESHPDLASKLNDWHIKKENQLPLVWVTMIQRSHETHSMLERPNGLIFPKNIDDYKTALKDLNYLSNLYSQEDVTIQSQSFEQSLQRLKNTRLPATLWHSQAVMENSLRIINAQVENALESINCKEIEDKFSQIKHKYEQTIMPLIDLMFTLDVELKSILIPWLERPFSEPFHAALAHNIDTPSAELRKQVNQHHTLLNSRCR